MDYSFDVPSEPRLSNIMLKSRPKPNFRREKKIRRSLILDDAVPLDGKYPKHTRADNVNTV